MSKFDIDAWQVKDALGHNIASAVEMLLPGGKLKGSVYHAGSVNGESGKSLQVAIMGPKAGMWHDFATGEGGDILTLWMVARGLNFGMALREAANFVGIKPRCYSESFRDEIQEAHLLCEKSKEAGLNIMEKKRLRHIQKILDIRDRLNY